MAASIPAVILAVTGILLSIVAWGLVSGWATGSSGDDRPHTGPGWIGPARYWSSYVFAWHPILMVSGFFFSQVLSIAAWTFAPESSAAVAQKIVFWFWQASGIAFLVAGLSAIVSYKTKFQFYSLITLHSWIGVAVVVLFGSNIIFGILSQTSKPFVAFFGKNIDLKHTHKLSTIITLFLTAAAIVTGIVDKLGWHGCNYVNTDYSDNDLDPARRFYAMPGYCKVAYGLGVAVVFATVFAILAATYDGFDVNSYKPSTEIVSTDAANASELSKVEASVPKGEAQI